ncbi:MAG: VOC family protein [Betaproteobacteria bacterium]
MPEQSPFIWHELVTSDQMSSGTFFGQLFGWTRKEVDAGPFGIYTLFQKDGHDVAGMMNPTPDTPGQGSYWHSYISVADVDRCAKQAPLLGGKLVVPPHGVPAVGRICVVADPTGYRTFNAAIETMTHNKPIASDSQTRRSFVALLFAAGYGRRQSLNTTL